MHKKLKSSQKNKKNIQVIFKIKLESKIEKLLNIQEKLSNKERNYQFYSPLH